MKSKLFSVLVLLCSLFAFQPVFAQNFGIIASSIQTGGATFAGLLDTVPNASLFYSMRRVNSAYTGNLLRVRRSSDLTELNIGAVGDTLDVASMETFCGSNTCYVVYWYDQSGNGRDAVGRNQGTGETNLPIIVNSGTTVKLNNRVAIYTPDGRSFEWTDTGTDISDLITAVGGGGATKKGTFHMVGDVADTGSNGTPYIFACTDPGDNEYWWFYEDSGAGRIEFNGTAAGLTNAITRDAQTIWCAKVDGSSFAYYEDGASAGSSSNGSSQTSSTTQVTIKIGGDNFSTASRTTGGHYQELGSWKTAENQTTLYNSANAYW